MRSIILALMCATLLAACVRTSTSIIDERTAIVSARGSAFDSPAAVLQGVLVTSARMTASRGFRYFAVVGAQDTSRSGAIYVPGQTYASGTVTGMGNTATFSGQSYTTPGTTFGFVKPGAQIVIKMYREGEIDPKTAKVWDAQSIIAAQPQK